VFWLLIKMLKSSANRLAVTSVLIVSTIPFIANRKIVIANEDP